MKLIKVLILGLTLMLGACNAQRNVLYIQDLESGTEIELPESYLIRIKPQDQITVVVTCKNPELAMPFNTATSYGSLTGNIASTVNTESSLQVLTVNQEGFITMPVIGEVHCEGLTREELSTKIENMIREGGYIEDPHVNVRFANLTISIVGEVNRPGRYDIKRDKISIFEALALAGDMTIYGSPEDVAVVRERDGKSIITKLDLRSNDIFTSPCYYLEQNDVIIVNPNKYRAATSEINQNRSFWISLASTAISLATLLITVIR